MDKKTVQVVMSVILGIAAFTIIATVVSLLFDAILAEDTITIAEPSKNVEDVIMYIKHSSVAVICISIPTVVCYFLTYFSKSKKIFGLISAVLSLMLIAMCLGFIFDLRGVVLDYKESANTSYTLATAYFTELGKLLISYVFAGAYFAVIFVRAFRTKQSTRQATVAAPEQGE